jgi:hypothetical protein
MNKEYKRDLSGIGSRLILALTLRYLEPKSLVLGEIN